MQSEIEKEFPTFVKRKIIIKDNKVCVDDSLSILFKVLNWIGIGTTDTSGSYAGARLCVKYAYPLFALLTVFDGLIMFSFHIKDGDTTPKISLAHICISVISLVAWYALFKKKKSLKHLFQTLQLLSESCLQSDVPRSFVLKTLLLSIFILGIAYPAVLMIDSSEADFYCTIFSYHTVEKCGHTFGSKLYLFAKMLFLGTVTSFFINIVSLVYCCVCFRCCGLLSRYRDKIQRIISSKTYNMLQPNLGLEYQNLVTMVMYIQEVFSVPSLFIFLVAFMQSFIILGSFLLSPFEQMSLSFITEHICLHISSGIFSIVIPACAAQIFKEMMLNKAAFYKIYENIVFQSRNNATKANVNVLSTLKRMEPIKLSAFEMVEFTGGTIPATLGTLLTYSLLILNNES